MRLAPEVFRAANIRWELFLTLTWRSTPPRAEKRGRALKHYLRMVARRLRVPYEELIWLARDGDPGRENRPHFHVLIAGCPPGSLDLELGCYLAKAWYYHGAVEGRLFNSSLGALVYSGLDGADTYESGRFVSSVPIMLSESVGRVVGWPTGDNVEREDAEQSDNPVPVPVLVREAGSVQKQLDLTSLVAEERGYLASVNASRTHVHRNYIGRADITGAI